MRVLIETIAGYLLLVGGLSAMEMHAEGSRLVLSGSVDGLDYRRFTRMNNEHTQIVVLRDSLGGDATAGLDLAREIRRHGLTTLAQGYRFSSCAAIFMGGKERRLADGEAFRT